MKTTSVFCRAFRMVLLAGFGALVGSQHTVARQNIRDAFFTFYPAAVGTRLD